jgi:hypothetical protein
MQLADVTIIILNTNFQGVVFLIVYHMATLILTIQNYKLKEKMKKIKLFKIYLKNDMIYLQNLQRNTKFLLIMTQN